MTMRHWLHVEIAALLLALGGGAAAQQAPPSGHVPPDPPAQPLADMPHAQMEDAMQMHDDAAYGMFKLDQFEHALGDAGAGYELEAWYGRDFDKLWLRSEGERRYASSDLRAEVFWDHAFASFWDWQLGVRHDFGSGPARQWAAFGVQGIAPYWFELEATAYVGESGRGAARLRGEYELLLTQRWILQAESEANLYARSDARREVGSGLSDASIGLRLRYEFRREFAPYVGVIRQHRFGAAAGFARAAGHDVADTQLVAGLRIWF